MSNTSLFFDDTQTAFKGKSNADLRKSYYLFQLMSKQWLVKLGSTIVACAFKWRVPIAPIVKYTVYNQFCGGENLKEVKKLVNRLDTFNLKVMLDYGVEAKTSEADFEETTVQTLKAIEYAETEETVPAVSSKITGLARFALLEKINEGEETLNETEVAELDRVRGRLHKICRRASKANTAVYFDAEESWIQGALDSLVREMMEEYNQMKPIVYNTVQLYRHDRLEFLKKNHLEAQENQYILAIKLVRGAYMEKERKRAEEQNYPSPIQVDKAATDRDFDLALRYCVEHVGDIAFCNASHNEESALNLCAFMEEKDLAPEHPYIYFAQLYGMSDHISYSLAAKGYNMAKYLPYGAVKEVIPYLIRRANENTSVAGQTGRELSLLKREMKRRGLVI